MLITPKNAIQIVLARKTKDARFRPYETSLQKWLFWFAVAGLAVGAGAGLLTYFWKSQAIVLVALLALLVSSLLAMGYQIALALPDLVKLRNIEREISNPLLEQFNDDMDLVVSAD